jgi:hypothetical protein
VKRTINFLILLFITSVLLLVLFRINQNKKESYIPHASAPVTPLFGRLSVNSVGELLPLALRINLPERPDYEIIKKHPRWLLDSNLIDIREPEYRLHLFAFYREYLAKNGVKGLLLRDLGKCPDSLSTNCESWWDMSQKELVAELRQQLSAPVIFYEALPITEENWELNRHYFLSLDGVAVKSSEIEAFKEGIGELVPKGVFFKKTILAL